VDRVDLVIIGAGQSGLSAAFEARRAGISTAVLEAADTPAGSWPRYYDSLTLFSPARYSSLPGTPFPGNPDRYPTRDEVVAYLSDYAAQFGDTIRLGNRVESVSRNPDGGFTATTESRDEFRAGAVIAASGQFGAPHRPALPGLESFTGSVLHAAEYDGPSRFAGQRVALVGAGNSAIQIAVELAETARTTLATRAPISWKAQHLLGRDVHWWLRATRFDTAPLARWLGRVPVSVIDGGRYRAAVDADRPDRRPMFDHLDGSDVVWSDGSREALDALILATGYRPHVPYLEGTGALGADGSPLHRRGLSTAVPGLGYVGLEFQRSFSSNTLRGCGRDARFVVAAMRSAASPSPVAVAA
jgi:putative flavoprotein involved in K+ transport